MITDFTDKHIKAIAGWDAWKKGRDLNRTFENLKISSNSVSGVLKYGRKKIQTTVKLVEGELVPFCTCDYYRETHGFCEHAVALLLQAREAKAINNKQVSETPTKSPQDTWTYRLDIKMPLAQAVQKKAVPAVLSMSKGGDMSPNGLSLLSALGVQTVEGDQLLSLPLESVVQLLKAHAQHRFIYIQGQELDSGLYTLRFPIEMIRRDGEILSLQADGVSGWQLAWVTPQLAIFCHGETGAYTIREISIAGDIIVSLLAGETAQVSVADYLLHADTLGTWFNLQAVDELIHGLIEPQEPQFKLDIKGTAKAFDATLVVSYNGQESAPSKREFDYLGYDAARDTFRVTDKVAEQRAMQYLYEAECSQRAGGREFHLQGEELILEFIAYTLPQIRKQGWEVLMLGSIKALSNNVVSLELRLEIDPVRDGDEFLSFQYTFQTDAGKGMKAAEVQRLMQTGKQSFKLKNGKIALLSKKQYQLISETIMDCAARQTAGKYLVPIGDLDYLLNTGIETKGESPQITMRSDELRPVSFADSLRSYQQEGLQWLYATLIRHHSALLADDMGLGKTVQTIALIEALSHRNEGPILIICPASLISNWAAELAHWLPDQSFSVIRGAESPSAGLNITSYQKYLSDARVHQEIDYSLIVLDEASYIKNPDAKISKALARQSATYKLALTGTPLENSAHDIWSIFQFLSPQYLGKKSHFTDRFVKPMKQEGYSAQLAMKRLRAKLKNRMLRRTKSAVLTELPPKTYRVEYCTPSPAQTEQATQIKAEYAELMSSQDKVNQMEMLTVILRLRQIANDPALLGNADSVSSKTKRLISIIDQAKTAGKKVLVFSQFAQMLHILQAQLEDAGHTCSILTGATKDRDSEIASFKHDHGVFLISLKAGGYGLNLTEASIVVHYDPWWNPAVEGQATDRAYRMGQSEPVTVYKLATAGSIDEEILKLQKSKESLNQLSVDEHRPDFAGVSREELERLIS